MKTGCVWKSKRVIPGYKIDGKLSLTAHKVCVVCGQEGVMTDLLIKTKDPKT